GLESVGCSGLGSSMQGKLCGSQPSSSAAPCWTWRFPFTVKLELPLPVLSSRPKAATTAAPGFNVRLPLMRAGPALTAHTPVTVTLELYVPASTPGDSKLPVQLAGRAAAAPVAL